MVPGIDVSDDPLLQGRLFSYLDTQLNRFGTPNFAQLPINQPKSSVNNFQQDGPCASPTGRGKANYQPNSLTGTPKEAPPKKDGYVHYPAPVQGMKIRERSKTFGDHYTQAALFYNSLTLPEQEHIGQALTFELSKVSDARIRKLMLEHLAKVDRDWLPKSPASLGCRRRKASCQTSGKTKGLSQEEGPKDTIKGRKVAILAADGVTSADIKRMEVGLKKEGATAEVVAPQLGELKGGVAWIRASPPPARLCMTPCMCRVGRKASPRYSAIRKPGILFGKRTTMARRFRKRRGSGAAPGRWCWRRAGCRGRKGKWTRCQTLYRGHQSASALESSEIEGQMLVNHVPFRFLSLTNSLSINNRRFIMKAFSIGGVGLTVLGVVLLCGPHAIAADQADTQSFIILAQAGGGSGGGSGGGTGGGTGGGGIGGGMGSGSGGGMGSGQSSSGGSGSAGSGMSGSSSGSSSSMGSSGSETGVQGGSTGPTSPGTGNSGPSSSGMGSGKTGPQSSGKQGSGSGQTTR